MMLAQRFDLYNRSAVSLHHAVCLRDNVMYNGWDVVWEEEEGG